MAEEIPMPIECEQLAGRPVPFVLCPKCGEIFYPFLRGMVQRRRYRWLFWGPWPYCALICWACKEIVGYESL
jgi:phage terminase large subunit GpA-like protein